MGGELVTIWRRNERRARYLDILPILLFYAFPLHNLYCHDLSVLQALSWPYLKRYTDVPVSHPSFQLPHLEIWQVFTIYSSNHANLCLYQYNVLSYTLKSISTSTEHEEFEILFVPCLSFKIWSSQTSTFSSHAYLTKRSFPKNLFPRIVLIEILLLWTRHMLLKEEKHKREWWQ